MIHHPHFVKKLVSEKERRDLEREALKVRVREEASDLKSFLGGVQGQALLEALKKKNSYIVLAVSEPGAGRVKVWYVDGNGLQSTIEASGTWVAYCTDPKQLKPTISTVSAEEVVSVWIAYKDQRSETRGRASIVDYLSS